MVDQDEADRVIASAYVGWVEPRASPTNPTWWGSPEARPTLRLRLRLYSAKVLP